MKPFPNPMPTPRRAIPTAVRFRALVALASIVVLLGLGSTAPLCAMGGSGDRCAMGAMEEAPQTKTDHGVESIHAAAPKNTSPSAPPCHGAPEPVERLSGLCCCSLDSAPAPTTEAASLSPAPSQPVAFDVDGSPVFRPQLRTPSPAREVPARPPGGRGLLALHSILLL